jgi:phage terminase large subunit-like protein
MSFRGADAIAWIEEFCRIPKGPRVGEPVRLLEYQRAIVAGIFDTPTRRCIISLGRQNAKTTLAAYLLLLHLAGPRFQRNGLLVSSALTREQAGILFDTATKIVRLSPELAATVVPVEFQKILRCPELGTVYRALSADAPTQLGLSPFFNVHDELGAVEGAVFQALRRARVGQRGSSRSAFDRYQHAGALGCGSALAPH